MAHCRATAGDGCEADGVEGVVKSGFHFVQLSSQLGQTHTSLPLSAESDCGKSRS